MVRFKIILKARNLRKEQTKTEQILWKTLRNNSQGVKWRRQHPVDMFILDFYAPKIKLAIELDGSTHSKKENKEYDEARTQYLESKNINLLRFWNSEIERDLERALIKIKQKIKELSST